HNGRHGSKGPPRLADVIAQSDKNAGEADGEPSLLVERIEMAASLLAPCTKHVENEAQGRQVVAVGRRHSGTVIRVDDSSGVRVRVVCGCAFRECSVRASQSLGMNP